MNDQLQSVREDIAFMKTMAAEGSRGPLLGGEMMATAGVLYAVAALAVWALAAGMIDADPFWYGGIWYLAGAIHAPILIFQIVAARRRGRLLGGPASELFGTVWQAQGMVIGSVFFALLIASLQSGDPTVWRGMSAAVLATYGAGWMLTWAIAKTKWLLWVSYASYASAVCSAVTFGEGAGGYLFYAVVIFLLIGVPGFVLMRNPSPKAG